MGRKSFSVSYATFEQRDTTAVISLNRPDRLNAISNALMADLQTAIERAERSNDIRAVVLTGAGRAFCAGEDLKEFEQITQSEQTVRQHITAIQVITRAMRHSSKVYITAAHGYAVGGGFEWMINGDLVVAADDLVAYFPEMDQALFPTGGVSWLLPMAVGYHRAMELVLLGERQSAERLQQLGLVNWMVTKQHLLEKALEIATRIATKSAFSVAQFKKLLNQDLAPLSRTLELEQQYTIEAFRQPEAARKATEFPLRASRETKQSCNL
jgi:enoyl-CoA hydratase/carnithine racemase